MSANGHQTERDLLQLLAAETAEVVGDAFCRSLVRHVAAAYGADVAFIAEHLAEARGRARVVAAWQRGADLPEGHEFVVDATQPGGEVARDGVLVVPEGALERWPGDRFAAAHGLDAYLGVALFGVDGVVVGHLGIMGRERIEPDADEVAVLRIFAARAAAEIERRRHLAALRARDGEVAAARSRMVESADAERRRIGRDLHDGAQQRVVALGHLIGLVRRRLGDDAPAAAVELLDRAADEARLASQELRELARGLHPAGLAEQGLVVALEALAQRSPVPVVFGELPERRLPAALELTAFYLASEAVNNAHKYAGAGQVTVAVVQRLDAVVVTVADDGAGGADLEAGTGLRGLRDRVAALGGTLAIDSPPGAGTRLEAVVPLSPWRSAREPFLEFGHVGDDGRGLESIRQVMDGHKRATVSLAREWDLEGGPPRIGQRLPVMDPHGRRHTTVEVERVALLPFGQVGEDVIADTAAEEDAAAWRASYRAFYDRCREELALLLGEPGWRLTDEEPMVVTWFRVIPD